MSKREIISSLAIIGFLALTSKVALAHSDRDHSTVSYKWAMYKNLQSKVGKKLDSANRVSLIGLNPFEKKSWSITTSTLAANSILWKVTL